MNKTKVILGVAFVVVAGAFFYGGIKFQQSKVSASGANRSTAATAAGARARAGGFRGAGAGSDFINGQIISKDANGITVQLMSNPNAAGAGAASTSTGSKIVILSGSTQISKYDAGTASDLTVGQSVVVTGTDNSDGSVTAQNIQIRPQGMGGPGASGASSSTQTK